MLLAQRGNLMDELLVLAEEFLPLGLHRVDLRDQELGRLLLAP